MIKLLETVASMCGVSEPVEELIYMIPIESVLQQQEDNSNEKDVTLFNLVEPEEDKDEQVVELVNYVEPVVEVIESSNVDVIMNKTTTRMGLLGQLVKAMVGIE